MLDLFLKHFADLTYCGLFVCCVFAWLKGGPAEKGGSICIVLNWAVGAVAQSAAADESAKLYANLILDTALAVAFLLLALRFSSVWLGSCMTLQGANLTLQSMQWTGSGTNAVNYYILNDVICVLLLASLLGGTIATWRKSRRGGGRPGRLEAQLAPCASAA